MEGEGHRSRAAARREAYGCQKQTALPGISPDRADQQKIFQEFYPDLEHFKGTGHGNTSAATQGGEPEGFSPVFHSVNQGYHDPAAG